MSEEREEGAERLPAAYRAPYAQVVHHVTPPEDATELREEMRSYPHTRAPQVKYSNLSEKDIPQMRRQMRSLHDINWISARQHTMAEYATKLRMNMLLDLDFFGMKNGFMRREANTSTINQNQNYTEVRRGRRSLTRPWRTD